VCVSKRRWCRRVDGYIWLRNVGKMELRVVRHLELEWCSVDRLVCDWWRVAKRRWCRRVDWYIWLRNVGKMERRVVRYLELEWCSVDRVVCVCVGLVTSEEWRNASGGNMEESYSSREPLGPGKRPKKFLKFFFGWKRLYEMCDENTYVVSRCRRGVWYIKLRDIGKIEQ